MSICIAETDHINLLFKLITGAISAVTANRNNIHKKWQINDKYNASI